MIENMRTSDRAAFFEWYDTVKDQPYVFFRLVRCQKSYFFFAYVRFHTRSELDKYCMADCSVLRKAVFAFRGEFMRLFGFDIFEKCSTLAGGVMRGYRLKYLQPGTIQTIPEFSEDRCRRSQSVMALKFLAWLSHTTGKNIRTAGSFLGERRVQCGNSNYWADGVVEDGGQIREVHEIYGCLFHGCLKCFPDRTALWIDGVSTYEEVFNRTVRRMSKMRQALPGCVIFEYWEHEYNDLHQNNDEMSQFVDGIEIPGPLCARDGFFGGR